MPHVDVLPLGADTIRILLTTDNHVGYLENDPIRGNDSWKTFQEITSLAKQHDVDMVVQGGDLFHVSKPSKKSLFHVIQLLRLNCLGDRPCELELLSDPSSALRMGDSVNYEDPNLNVSVPVFAISGNHDDATGEGLLLPMDVLAATGLINYFGQIPRLDRIIVTPLVFQKGTTKLALYGINNVRDERLQRIMKNGDVTFQKPKSDSEFFNLLCVHQNHFRHTMTSYVPEDFFPSFLDFVLWGHEHECMPYPQYNPTTGFDSLQPGSSVATSLSEGEAAEKHVFLLDIKGKDYALTPIPLQTVRPFLIKDVRLKAEGFVEGPASKADILAFLIQKVEDLIAEANRHTDQNTSADPSMLPLIRLRVDHSGNYEVENSRRFSNRFVGRIANVNDVILYHKKKAISAPATEKKKTIENKSEAPITLNTSIQKILKDYLGDSNLNLVPETGIFDVTKKFIEQDDRQILTDYVEKTITNTAKLLLAINIDEDEFHRGDDVLVKRSFRQLLNKLRIDTQRQPLAIVESGHYADCAAPKHHIFAADEFLISKLKNTSRARAQIKRRVASKERTVNENESDVSDKEFVSESRNMRDTRALRYQANEPDGNCADRDMEDVHQHQLKPSTKQRSSAKAARVSKPTTKKATTKKKSSSNHILDDLLSLG